MPARPAIPTVPQGPLFFFGHPDAVCSGAVRLGHPGAVCSGAVRRFPSPAGEKEPQNIEQGTLIVEVCLWRSCGCFLRLSSVRQSEFLVRYSAVSPRNGPAGPVVLSGHPGAVCSGAVRRFPQSSTGLALSVDEYGRRLRWTIESGKRLTAPLQTAPGRPKITTGPAGPLG